MTLQQDINALGTGSPYPYDRLLVVGTGTISTTGAFLATGFPVSNWFQLVITPTGIALAVDGVGKGMVSTCTIASGFSTYTSYKPANLSTLIPAQDINTVTLQKSQLGITATANDSHEKIMAGLIRRLLTLFSASVWNANPTTMIRAVEQDSYWGGAAKIDLSFALNDLAWVWNDVDSPQVYIPGTGAYGSALPSGDDIKSYLLVSSALPASIQAAVFAWALTAGIWQQESDTDFLLLKSSFNSSGRTILWEGYFSQAPTIEIFPLALPISPTTILWEGYFAQAPTIEIFPLALPISPTTILWEGYFSESPTIEVV